jgi:predicted amidohydrolase
VRSLKKLVLALPLLTLGAMAQQTLGITHVTIIDMVTGKTQPDTTVMIQGNRITGIALSTSLAPKAGQIIDARGEYLIPGLWDMHTHVYFDSTAADGTDLVLPLFLANGITGVRDRWALSFKH